MNNYFSILKKQEKIPVESKSKLNSFEDEIPTSPNRPLRQPTEQRAPTIPGSAVRLNEEQMAKLQSELDLVDNNILVMNEILNEVQKMDKMNLQSAEVKNDIFLLQVKINRI